MTHKWPLIEVNIGLVVVVCGVLRQRCPKGQLEKMQHRYQLDTTWGQLPSTGPDEGKVCFSMSPFVNVAPTQRVRQKAQQRECAAPEQQPNNPILVLLQVSCSRVFGSQIGLVSQLWIYNQTESQGRQSSSTSRDPRSYAV